MLPWPWESLVGVRFLCAKTWRTYTRPRLSRTINPSLTRVFRLRFQKTGMGNTARNKSVAELTAIAQLVAILRVSSGKETYC